MVRAIHRQLASGLRQLAAGVLGLLAVLALLALGLWWWAGTPGSLATAVELVDNYAPQLIKNLNLQNPRGSLRTGGQFDRITWQREGLKVDATAVTLAWQPWALVSGTFKLDRFAAGSVVVDNRQPKASPAKPPESLRLPVRVVVDKFDINQLSLTGVTPFSASDMAGSFSFDGQRHVLELTRSTVAHGNYNGRASVAADPPFALDAALAGTVSTALPGSSHTLPLSFTSVARGTLADVQADASLQIDYATNSIALSQTKASVTARITPWEAQPERPSHPAVPLPRPPLLPGRCNCKRSTPCRGRGTAIACPSTV